MFTEAQISEWIIEILLALQYMHNRYVGFHIGHSDCYCLGGEMLIKLERWVCKVLPKQFLQVLRLYTSPPKL